MPPQKKDVGTVIDDLTTTDIGGRDTIYPIAGAAEKIQGDNPAMQAARALKEAVDYGDNVLILTGFLIPPTMVPETDGPLGAVSIARAVDEGLEANPIIACESQATDCVSAAAKAGGLSVLDRERSFEGKRSVAVDSFPADPAGAEKYTNDVLEKLDPSAIVAVEKVAPNEEGIYHNMAGYDITGETAKVETLFDEIDDVLTIAVGDAGNEVGMGVVADTVRNEIEYGDTCQCPCEGGIASSIETDILVPATVSNWGGHAITACLSELVERPLLHEPQLERRMLEEATMAGAIDGIVAGSQPWCDGLPAKSHTAIVQLIREVLGSSVHARGGGELSR